MDPSPFHSHLELLPLQSKRYLRFPLHTQSTPPQQKNKQIATSQTKGNCKHVLQR